MDALNKSIYVIALYDIYQGLLTDKQKKYIEYYYFDNLSISEISENLGVSRNAVHDQIKRAVKKLEDIEEAIEVNKDSKYRSKIYNKLRSLGYKDVNKLLEELEKVE